MILKHAIPVCCLALTACGSVQNQSTSSITVDGNSYELKTEEIQGPNGTFDNTSVIVNGREYLCKPESPNDCEDAVVQALNSDDSGQ
jgi:hypothetical protein